MISLEISESTKILCIGAHPDDIEIGCGATLLQWSSTQKLSEMVWFVASGAGERRGEQQESASRYFERSNSSRLVHANFTDNRFPTEYQAIKDSLVELSRDYQPDLIFTHRLEDRHQDHRLLAELTWNVWRNSLVLEYEIPKWEGDLGHPQLYSEVEESLAEQKIAWLAECHASQAVKDWFDADLFRGLMRIRGSECRSFSRMAEAFHLRKSILRLRS